MQREEGRKLLSQYTKDYKIIEEQLHNTINEYIMINLLDTSYYDNIYTCKLEELEKAFKESDLEKRLKKEKDLKNELTRLSPQKLMPNVWEDIIYKKKLIKEKQNNIATSDIYECPICFKRKCIVTQAQIRSADEPMTTFFRCVECGHTMSFE